MLDHDRAEATRQSRPSVRVAARQADARKRILEAARVVISEQSFAGAQVATVADVADVATGTIYRHFASKDALFSEVLRRVCERELQVVQAIAAETNRTATERVRDAVSTFVTRAIRGENLAYSVIVEPMSPTVDQVRLDARHGLCSVFASLITDGITQGEFRDQNVRLSGAAIVGAFLEGLVEPLEHLERTPLEQDQTSQDLAQFCVSALTHRI